MTALWISLGVLALFVLFFVIAMGVALIVTLVELFRRAR